MRASFLAPVLTRCSKGEGITSLRDPCERRVVEVRDECERDECARVGAVRPVRPDCAEERRVPLAVDRDVADRDEPD